MTEDPVAKTETLVRHLREQEHHAEADRLQAGTRPYRGVGRRPAMDETVDLGDLGADPHGRVQRQPGLLRQQGDVAAP